MSGSLRVLSVAILLGGFASCGGDPVGQPSTESQGPLITPTAVGALNAHDQHGSRHIAILDDCDSSDPDWAPTGGCALRDGAVREDEFGELLVSSLALSVVGHPGWRNQPSYLRVPVGTSVLVTNEGGRLHTFTPVAAFGGGRVPPLNVGLTPAPECLTTPDPNQVGPGGRKEINNLSAGNHRFQCCIHPWMRALIKVE